MIDGALGVLDSRERALRLYNDEGALERRIDLGSSLKGEHGRPDGLLAAGQRFFVRFDGHYWVFDHEGTEQCRIPLDAGDRSPVSGRSYQLDTSGVLWGTDGYEFYELACSMRSEQRMGTPADERLQRPGGAYLDHLGRVLVQDVRTGDIHVFDAEGDKLFVCPAEVDETGEVSAATRGYVATGGMIHWENETGGDRYNVYDGPTRTQAYSLRAVCVTASPLSNKSYYVPFRDWGRINVREDGEEQSSILRRPDGRKWREIYTLACNRRGDVFVLEGPCIDPMRSIPNEPVCLAVLGQDDAHSRLIDVSSIASTYVQQYFVLVASGDWVVLGGGASFLLNPSSGEFFELNLPTKTRWCFGFAADGNELWALDVPGGDLHRFELP